MTIIHEGGEEKRPYQRTSYSDFIYRVLIAAALTALITLLILLMIFTYYAFLLVFAGILAAMFFRGGADWINRITGLPERWSLLLEFFLLLGMAGLAVWLMSTTLIDQFSQLAQQIPESIEQIREALDETEIGRVFLRALPEPEALVQSATNVATRTAGIFSTIIGAVSAALIILFIGVYCSLDPSLYVNGMLRLIPIDKRERAHQILRALTHVLRWWLVGRIFSMLVLGILTGVGLWLLGVPLALALGVLTGLLTFIPYLGSILSFIPIIVLALSKGFTLGLYALFLYLGVQTIESYFLTPYVEKKAVALPPSLTLIVQVISGILFGILGIIVASPLTAAVMVLVRTLYVRDFLGDDISITKSKETDAQIE